MRAIHKGEADYQLQQRHQNPPISAAEARSAWSNFRGERYARTRDKCLDEQYGLCGYSEIGLDDQDPVIDDQGQTLSRPLGIHLEHVEPKSHNPARTFDHSNLIACAIDDAI